MNENLQTKVIVPTEQPMIKIGFGLEELGKSLKSLVITLAGVALTAIIAYMQGIIENPEKFIEDYGSWSPIFLIAMSQACTYLVNVAKLLVVNNKK